MNSRAPKTKGIVLPEEIRWSTDIAAAALKRLDSSLAFNQDILANDQGLAGLRGLLAITLAGVEEIRRFLDILAPLGWTPDDRPPKVRRRYSQGGGEVA